MKNDPYCTATRQMIVDTREDIKRVENSIEKIDGKITELFNHQSSRLPMWTTIILTLLSSLTVGLIVGFAK